MDKDTSVIPSGLYCYSRMELTDEKTEDGLPILRTTPCPYWSLREDKPEQVNGYCSYLGAGDWEDDGPSLLWDQCKECGINENLEEEDA